MNGRLRKSYVAALCSLLMGCGGLEGNPVADLSQDLSTHRRCSFGPWATVDDYVFPGAATSRAAPSGVAVDVFDNAYVVGSANDGTTMTAPDQWIVRKSSDGGSTWSGVDQFLYSGSTGTAATGLATDAAASIYVTGTTQLGGSNSHWLVRRSTDAGATWTIVDDFQHPTGVTGVAGGAVFDSSGNLFVSGYSDNVEADGTRTYHWITRKSADSAATWTTSDDVLLRRSSVAYANAADLQGNVYAVGFGNDFNTVQWTTRNLARTATTWTTVDAFNLGTSTSANALPDTATVDDANVIYAGGYAYDDQGLNHGLVRASADHGATWSTVDDFRNGGFNCRVMALTANIPAKTCTPNSP